MPPHRRRDPAPLTRRALVAGALALGAAGAARGSAVAAAEILLSVEGRFGRFPARAWVDPGDPLLVTEFFSYACVHCFSHLAALERFAGGLRDDVEFRRLPVVFRDTDRVLARAYFVADELGMVETMHRPLFEQIHLGKRQPSNREAMLDTLESFGLPRERIEALYESDEIAARLRYADRLQRFYGVRATPLVVVDGRFWTSPRLDRADFIGTAHALVEATRQLRAEGG